MFTLVKREIEDRAAMFVLGAAFAIFATLPLLFHFDTAPKSFMETGVMAGLFTGIPIISLGAICLGVLQIKQDKGSTAFLTATAVSRTRVFWAKVIAGAAWILFVTTPIFLATRAYINNVEIVNPGMIILLKKIFITSVLLSLACYGAGLYKGAGKSTVFGLLCAALLAAIMVSLVVIKGFSFEMWGISTLIAAASLLGTWHKIKTASF